MGNPVQASRICITPTMAAVKHASPTYSSGQVSGIAWPMVVKHGGRHPGDLKLGELPVTPQVFFFHATGITAHSYKPEMNRNDSKIGSGCTHGPCCNFCASFRLHFLLQVASNHK